MLQGYHRIQVRRRPNQLCLRKKDLPALNTGAPSISLPLPSSLTLSCTPLCSTFNTFSLVISPRRESTCIASCSKVCHTKMMRVLQSGSHGPSSGWSFHQSLPRFGILTVTMVASSVKPSLLCPQAFEMPKPFVCSVTLPRFFDGWHCKAEKEPLAQLHCHHPLLQNSCNPGQESLDVDGELSRLLVSTRGQSSSNAFSLGRQWHKLRRLFQRGALRSQSARGQEAVFG